MFDKYIKYGVKITRKDGKKRVTGIPKNWQKLTESSFNNQDNFAILTGKLNDILVIDIDNKEDMPGKAWFEETLGPIDELNTLVTKTINGGYHIYYKFNESIKNSNNFLGKHIDVLVTGKCVYEGKGYTVIRNYKPIAPSDDIVKLFLNTI